MADSVKTSRPPVLAILLLVVLSLVLFAFVTARQIASAENRRLRLLASFSERVENAVPDLAERLSGAVKNEKRKSTLGLKEYVAAIPNLDWVSEDRGSGESSADSKTDSPTLSLEANGRDIYLTYRSKAEGDSETSRQLMTRFQLSPLVEPMIVPGVFDMVAITDVEGQVLFDRGEPELRLARLDALVETIGSKTSAKTLGSSASVVEIKLSDREHTMLADRNYTVFFQPISLELPTLDGETTAPIDWIACGIVSTDRMLSATVNSSPFLFLALVFFFPMAVVSWPFLKLWLITPRQRFSLFDTASLLFSSFLGLSILSLIVFGALFAARINVGVDEQLGKLANHIEKQFRHEILDVYRQMSRLDQISHLSKSLIKATPDDKKRQEVAKVLTEVARKGGETNLGKDANKSGDEKIQSPLHYPHFHSIVWADDDGIEKAKLPLRETSVLTSSIRRREYFQCAKGNLEKNVFFDSSDLDSYFKALSEEQGNANMSELVDEPWVDEVREAYKAMGDDEVRKASNETSETSAQVQPVAQASNDSEQHSPSTFDLCFEFVLSNTTGQDLAVIARGREEPSQGNENGTGSDDDNGNSDKSEGSLAVVAMVTRFLSLTEPILGTGFSYALVDSDGTVQVHSDARRSLTEDLIKASGQNQVLKSVLETRRGGTLNVTYLGRPHRFRVQALRGMPWSLVVLRDISDLRFRILELGYDFLNVWITYLILLVLFFGVPGFCFWHWRLGRRLAILWPSFTHNTAYGRIVLSTSFVMLAFGMALVSENQVLIFCLTLTLPIMILTLAGLWLHQARRSAERIERRGKRLSAKDFSFFPGAFSDQAKRRITKRVWLLLALQSFLVYSTIAIGLHRGSLSLAAFLLLALAFAILVFLIRSLYYFQAKFRLRPFRSAASCLFFIVSILPSVGFFHLASSRQTQFLVQDHQGHLAEAIEARKKNLESYKVNGQQLTDFFKTNGPVDDKTKAAGFLASFYRTEREDLERTERNELDTQTNLGSTEGCDSRREWPEGSVSESSSWLSSIATLSPIGPYRSMVWHPVTAGLTSPDSGPAAALGIAVAKSSFWTTGNPGERVRRSVCRHRCLSRAGCPSACPRLWLWF